MNPACTLVRAALLSPRTPAATGTRATTSAATQALGATRTFSVEWTLAIARALLITLTLIKSLISPNVAFGQELEPRAFSPAPVGINFVVATYGYSTGHLFVDPALPVEDATADLQQAVGMYVRTFGFFGKSAKALAIVPFASGKWEGRVADEFVSTSRTGMGDPRVAISVNFLGAPALGVRQFAGTYREETVAGASLQVIVPLGEYDSSKLINLGSNRWAFRPQIGLSSKLGPKWTVEVSASAWLFTDNDDFWGGQKREQDSIYAGQVHVLYSIRGASWAGAHFAYGQGGRTRADGVVKNDEQTNTRLGVTFALPLGRRHSAKLLYVNGISTRIGADFDSINLAYQYRWGGGL